MTVHLDVTQLIADPRRTGIQRAERELIRHWPGPAPLEPCCFDGATGLLRALPRRVLDLICADAPVGGVAADRARLAVYRPTGPGIEPGRLLNAELFADPARAALYRHIEQTRTYWLVYDFLPWLHPDWFSLGSPAMLMPYLQALRCAGHLAFISERTRSDYLGRVGISALQSQRSGPVIPMGGDGLGLERQRFTPARRTFVMLGTIEPRKNTAAVLEAFQRLWSDGVDAYLTIIGQTAPDAAYEADLMRTMASDLRFRYLGGQPDAGVRETLRGARAMLFPSEGEGFGIPPLEALHAGIPAIVSAGLPALADAPELGQVRLRPVSPETIAKAVRALLSDEAAARLWDEAARMKVPGWADFAQGIADWIQA